MKILFEQSASIPGQNALMMATVLSSYTPILRKHSIRCPTRTSTAETG